MALGPPCPHCGEKLPFGKTQFGLGKAFECPNCKKGIVIDKNIWAAPLAIISVVFVESYFDEITITLLYILLVCIALFMISRFFNNPMSIDEYKAMYPNAKI